jgi:hypothetical protein
MAKFFITYSYGSDLRKNYSVVEADDYDDARRKVWKETGGHFAFMYDETQWHTPAGETHSQSHTQADAYGLTEIPLQAQVLGCGGDC